MSPKPKAEDTVYWHMLTEEERRGKKGRDFLAFWKAWTKDWDKPIKELTYVRR